MTNFYTPEMARFVQQLRTSGFTWEEVADEFEKEFGERKSHDTLRISTKKMMDEPVPDHQETMPKILIYDIETSPCLGYVWGLWNNDIGLNQLYRDWDIMSYAAKWLGEDEVFYQDQVGAGSEKKLLQGIWKLLDEADIVITHNGKKFDERKLNARFIEHGLKPVGKKKHIDTLVIAKREFAFTSNKLEYLTNKFCVKHKKKSHSKFPGFSLWLECLRDSPAAWKEMKEYNIADVQALEELYFKLAPYDNTVNFNLFHDYDVTFCSCGSTDFRKNGFAYTNVSKFQRYTCKECGNHIRGRVNLLSKDKRKSLKARIT